MEVREIRIDVEKKVADGAYGNETVRVGFTVTVEEGAALAPSLTEVQQYAERVYALVLDRLKASTSEGIRQALETREEREARWAHEQDQYRRPRYPLEDAPSDEPLEGSGELPVKDEDSPF